ncbi:Gfo/Idh/MocA family protein [Pontibacter oryzae]|uniref:Gfo/Idh/MocA family oxidoreductase n=1 Tax=Pontibacter oryzae TaxID=2304593 RepID=A0A399SGR9_9BACT|nr:Gfo/Idh/MocA family oxidoreductase [Pontibacter oryzae]RIJ42780.1 gfo/Idh/MocA family oxidoreductase [Pontibacter oryzae]
MKEKKIRIGVLSTANIAVRSIIPAILDLPDQFEMVGIASRSLQKSEEISKLFNTRAFSDYDAILKPELLDAIYIPLPNSMHYEWVKKALEVNVHVLVEKSLGCNLQEVQELNELAESKGLVLLENFQFRFHSQLEFIKELVESGRIGALRCLRSSFGFPPFADKDNIRYQAELGGGALLDAAAYPTKIAQLFLGEDLDVAASNLNYEAESSVDIWGGAYLKQKNGKQFAEIAFGFDHFYQCNIELWGSEGKIYTNRIFTAPPGYKPEVIIETKQGKEKIVLEPDHHFKKMLLYFSHSMQPAEIKSFEYKSNINQARLLEQIKTKAK